MRSASHTVEPFRGENHRAQYDVPLREIDNRQGVGYSVCPHGGLYQNQVCRYCFTDFHMADNSEAGITLRSSMRPNGDPNNAKEIVVFLCNRKVLQG